MFSLNLRKPAGLVGVTAKSGYGLSPQYIASAQNAQEHSLLCWCEASLLSAQCQASLLLDSQQGETVIECFVAVTKSGANAVEHSCADCLQAVRAVKQQQRLKQRVCVVHAKTDYAATASDANVLQQPLKQELTANDVKHVFGYSNALKEK